MGERIGGLVEVSGLSLTFLDAAKPLAVLREVDLTVNRGEFFALVGPSGCGKTTLLRLIGGLLDASAKVSLSGKIEIGGRDPAHLQKDGEIGFAFQSPALLPWRNVRANANLPLELAPSAKSGLSVDWLLGTLGLEAFRDYFPTALSGGMQQRVALARSLVLKPKLLLMDEPFGALDAETRETLNMELLKLWRTSRATIVFVTHSLAEAVLLGDRVGILSARPAHVREIVAIDLPRPRQLEMLESATLTRYVKHLRRLLDREGGPKNVEPTRYD